MSEAVVALVGAEGTGKMGVVSQVRRGEDGVLAALPVDYVVDVLRVDVVRRGWRRVILLGDERDMGGSLKTGLARWGLQVLVPPAGERAWIASLAQRPVAEASPGEVARLRALLADGAEHGVEAIVAMSVRLASWVEACDLDVPTLVPEPCGFVVRVRNVVFDMGGVLFRWDPLAMARRVSETDDDARLLAQAVFDSPEWAWQDAGAVDEATVAWTAKTRVPRRLYAQVDELVYRWHENRVPLEGMDALIRDLKRAGFGVYLLSNAGASFERYEAQLPGRDCLDGMVVSYREHVVKPDARIYRILLERYGLAAEECLFVDDMQRNVLGARRVGMRAYRFDEDAPSSLRRLLLGGGRAGETEEA